MMVASYLIGQRKFPIAYHVRRLGVYALLAAVLYAVGYYGINMLGLHAAVAAGLRLVLLAVYVLVFIRMVTLASRLLPLASCLQPLAYLERRVQRGNMRRKSVVGRFRGPVGRIMPRV